MIAEDKDDNQEIDEWEKKINESRSQILRQKTRRRERLAGESF